MRKITDVGMYIPQGSKRFDKVPISYGGRSDMYNTPRMLHNPSRYVDSDGGSTPDLYALMVKYHLKGFEFFCLHRTASFAILWSLFYRKIQFLNRVISQPFLLEKNSVLYSSKILCRHIAVMIDADRPRKVVIQAFRGR